MDKIDVDKLKTVPLDLKKLSNVVNNEVVRKSLYNKLVAKVNNTDASEYALKTKYDMDKSDFEKKISDADKKIPDTVDLLKKQIIMQKLLKLKVKYIVLLVQLLLMYQLQLQIKYLMLVILLRKQIMTYNY